MNRLTLADLPPAFQAQARAQLGAVPHPKTIALPVSARAKPRLRQKTTLGLNKLETAYLAHLSGRTDATAVLVQAVTLKLANGLRYTPDFLLVWLSSDETAVRVEAHEVKGHMRDDAAVKLKVAAAQYRWIRFRLIWRDRKTGEWLVQNILP